jgi:hypothetical protein
MSPDVAWGILIKGDWHFVRGHSVLIATTTHSTAIRIRDRLEIALSLVQRCTPDHFAHLRRYLRAVVVAPIEYGRSSWHSSSQICRLELGYASAEDTTPVDLACALMHELARARLHVVGFRPDHGRRVRLERLYLLAERNFVARCEPSEDRERALDGIARRLARIAVEWSDTAVRDRYLHSGPKWRQAWRFVFRPLPEL